MTTNHSHFSLRLSVSAVKAFDFVFNRHSWLGALADLPGKATGHRCKRRHPDIHHDPDRTDTELDEIQVENERFFKQHYGNNRSYCAA
ncbi:MAG: hypothetical protein GQ550_09405 [Gammaproteobacteria bacterium]|nr:hypothetical protein [Gammaproteobacteria bacterium]